MVTGASRNRLVVGTRRYSSWSLRGWLAVRLAGLDVDEQVIPLASGGTKAIEAVSPSGLVPFLEHDGAAIWDSQAILEYCAEHQPGLWPSDRIARAHARAICAEMHAGFRALRVAMPMVCNRVFPPKRLSPEVRAEIDRIETLWAQTRARFAGTGTFLFGEAMTGADIMYAPVVVRFVAYQPDLGADARAYVAAINAHPLMQTWYQAASTEPLDWRLDRYEDFTP